ncbi:hypothetical protein [Verrucomicrobium spinosum]|uniref:hypothetical protein n=1 Tax=Verrucomicrobium spinosum TaxID=2736 RepID=UPI00210B721E|nr:hypothetical protein [Verrucomicrobium spinosum]
MQLDEVAAPILLAWRLKHKGNGLGLFDPWNMIRHAVGHLIQNGPVTMQERWEENAGYSPSTLATVIAAGGRCRVCPGTRPWRHLRLHPRLCRLAV